MIHRTFMLDGPFDEPIRGDLRLREGPPPRSAVVIAHGFKGFKDWAFFPHLGEELAASGFATVNFNFSRNGIGDDPEEFTELEAFAGNTLSRELDELLWMIDRVAESDLLPRRPDRVGLVGHSRGGGDAVLATRESGRVDALVTWNALATFDRWDEETKAEWRDEGRIHVLNGRTGQQMPLDVELLEDFEAHRDRLDIARAAREVSCPWLIVHGADDLTVHPDDARTLARAAQRGQLVWIEGAGHTFEAQHPFPGPTPELEQVIDATRRHFRTWLGED